MALSALEAQQLIAFQLGLEGDATFRAVLALAWKARAGEFAASPLVALYVKRDMLDYLLGKPRIAANGQSTAAYEATDWRASDGTSVSRSQRTKQLLDIRREVDASIKVATAQAAANRGGRVGAITRQTPVVVPDDRPSAARVDPNSPEYGGDALRRAGRR